MKSIRIGNRWVGPDHPCFVIAEAGVNHNGDLELAKKLIDVAAEAGADAVKFQTFRVDDLVIKTAEKAEYQKKTTGSAESQYDLLKKLELSDDAFFELAQYSQKRGIIFLSTPFDEQSVDLLENMTISAYKISSGDITNFPLFKKIVQKKKPIILSTGMSNLCEVEEAVSYIQEKGSQQIILLHCTTSYPAPFNSVNLYSIITMRHAFNVPVGYSDHTEGITIPIAAVALGANVIEKHITLDHSMSGPDHIASLEPDELYEMIYAIRNVEKALGNGVKKPTHDEIIVKKNARRSIVTLKPIKASIPISESDIGIKRPGSGIHPKYLDIIVGKKLVVNKEEGEVLYWSDFF